MKFTKEAYVANLNLKTIRVWSSSESEVKNLELFIVGYLKTQVCKRNRSMDQHLFQRN